MSVFITSLKYLVVSLGTREELELLLLLEADSASSKAKREEITAEAQFVSRSFFPFPFLLHFFSSVLPPFTFLPFSFSFSFYFSSSFLYFLTSLFPGQKPKGDGCSTPCPCKEGTRSETRATELTESPVRPRMKVSGPASDVHSLFQSSRRIRAMMYLW